MIYMMQYSTNWYVRSAIIQKNIQQAFASAPEPDEFRCTTVYLKTGPPEQPETQEFVLPPHILADKLTFSY